MIAFWINGNLWLMKIFVQSCLKEFGERMESAGWSACWCEKLVKVKIAKLIWKEFNCLLAVKWSIWWTYGGNSDGGDLIGVIVIRVLI